MKQETIIQLTGIIDSNNGMGTKDHGTDCTGNDPRFE